MKGDRMLNLEAVLTHANALYRKMKEAKGCVVSTFDVPMIQSDQVQAIAEALVDAVNNELNRISVAQVPQHTTPAPVLVAVAEQRLPEAPKLTEPGPVQVNDTLLSERDVANWQAQLDRVLPGPDRVPRNPQPVPSGVTVVKIDSKVGLESCIQAPCVLGTTVTP